MICGARARALPSITRAKATHPDEHDQQMAGALHEENVALHRVGPLRRVRKAASAGQAGRFSSNGCAPWPESVGL